MPESEMRVKYLVVPARQTKLREFIKNGLSRRTSAFDENFFMDAAA
jgi:hypothetical protein